MRAAAHSRRTGELPEYGEPSTPCGGEPARRKDGASSQKLGLWAVACIIFFNVSGGPFGSEEVVARGLEEISE